MLFYRSLFGPSPPCTLFAPFGPSAEFKGPNSYDNYATNFLPNAVAGGLNNLTGSVRGTAFGVANFRNPRLRVLTISA